MNTDSDMAHGQAWFKRWMYNDVDRHRNWVLNVDKFLVWVKYVEIVRSIPTKHSKKS